MANDFIPVAEENLQAVAPDTGAANFEARVQSYSPKAAQEFESASPAVKFGALQPLNFGNVPVVGPLYNKALDISAAAMGAGEGNTLGERYVSNQAYREARERAKEQAYPFTYNLSKGTTGSLGAFVPTLGVEEAAGAIASQAPSLIKNTAPYLGRMVEGGLFNAASSNAIPGETPEEAASRLAKEFSVGTLSAPIGSALTKTAQLGESAFNRVGNLFNPTRSMAQKIVSGAENAQAVLPKERQLTVQEYLDAKDRGDTNVSLADIQGVKPLIQGAEIAKPNDPNGLALNGVISERLNQNSNIIGREIDNAAGKEINPVASRDAAQKAYREAAGPVYELAFKQPGTDSVWPSSADRIINSREGQFAINYANNEMIKDGNILPSPFVVDPKTGVYTLRNQDFTQTGPAQAPNLEYWDYIKRGLNQAAQGQKADPNQSTAANSTQNMVRDLTGELRNKFPEYGDALDTAQRYIRSDNAHDAGGDFIKMIENPKANAQNVGNQIKQLDNYTNEERNYFKDGVLGFMKENPGTASNIFKNGDAQTLDRIKKAVGDDTFQDLSNTFQMARVRALTGELGISAKPKMSMPELAKYGAIMGTSAVGAGTAIHSGIQYAPQIAENLTNPYVLGTGIIAAGIGIPLAVGAKGAISGLANQRAGAMLTMAANPDAAVQKQLKDALNRDPLNRKIFDNLEQRITKFVSTHPDMNPATQQEEVGQASGGRVGHATGGKVSGSISHAKSILNDWKRRKVQLTNQTEHMLALPDDVVVQALDAAKR